MTSVILVFFIVSGDDDDMFESKALLDSPVVSAGFTLELENLQIKLLLQPLPRFQVSDSNLLKYVFGILPVYDVCLNQRIINYLTYGNRMFKYRFSFSCPWVTIFLHSRELNLKF